MDVDGPPERQLIDFQRLFPAFWEHPNVQGITLWGYREGHWRTQQEAPLVYGNGAEKPALRWLKGYLRGNAPVVAGPTTATLASARIRLHYGHLHEARACASRFGPTIRHPPARILQHARGTCSAVRGRCARCRWAVGCG